MGTGLSHALDATLALARCQKIKRNVSPAGKQRKIDGIKRGAFLRKASGKMRRFNVSGRETQNGHTINGLDLWERGRLRVWAKAGRLTRDGALRVVAGPPPAPYTLRRILRIWPHLKTKWRALPSLLSLGGVLERDDAGVKDQLIELVEAVVDMRFKRILGKALMDVRHQGEQIGQDHIEKHKKYTTWFDHPQTGQKVRRKELHAWLRANAADPLTMDWIKSHTQDEVKAVGFDTK